MRKSAITDDGGVPRSRHRSGAISSGSRSANVSAIHAMNGCGDLLSLVMLIHPGLGDAWQPYHVQLSEACIDNSTSIRHHFVSS